MSEWFDADPEDISLSDDGKELHIWFEFNDFGNRYVSAKVPDVLRAIKLYKEKR